VGHKAEIQKGGRVTIPAIIRKKLNVTEGDIVTISEENGDIKLVPQRQALALARTLAKPYLMQNNTVEDFLKWRKEEANLEEQDLHKHSLKQ
jgi:AbrB family looped-hinge helix DNA binding protein